MKLTRVAAQAAVVAVCATMITPAAHAQFGQNTTLGGDSGVSNNVVEVEENDNAVISGKSDADRTRPVAREVEVPRDRVQEFLDKMEAERQASGGGSGSGGGSSSSSSDEDLDEMEDEVSTGSDSRDKDDSGSSSSSNSGTAGVSNKDIKSKVDKAVSKENEKYKTVLDYFGAFIDGAQYHWGGPMNQVGAGGDCSGLMSQLVRIVAGENPWQRIFATTGEGQSLSAYGFKPASGAPKAGQLFIGWNGGHTAGNLPSTVKIESGGSNGDGGGGSINAYGRDSTVGGDDAQFTERMYLDWDQMDEKLHWDEGVSDWEDYLDGVSWKPWVECAQPGSSGPINPCAGITDQVNEEHGWTKKLDNFPVSGKKP